MRLNLPHLCHLVLCYSQPGMKVSAVYYYFHCYLSLPLLLSFIRIVIVYIVIIIYDSIVPVTPPHPLHPLTFPAPFPPLPFLLLPFPFFCTVIVVTITAVIISVP